MSGASEFAHWVVASFALAILVPLAVAVGLYYVLRRTFLLKPIWYAVISAGTLALVCAMVFAP